MKSEMYDTSLDFDSSLDLDQLFEDWNLTSTWELSYDRTIICPVLTHLTAQSASASFNFLGSASATAKKSAHHWFTAA